MPEPAGRAAPGGKADEVDVAFVLEVCTRPPRPGGGGP